MNGWLHDHGVTPGEIDYTWTPADDAPECREYFTRHCPRICAYLDGICARFGMNSERTGDMATLHYVERVMRK